MKIGICLGLLLILAAAHQAARRVDREAPRYYIETLRRASQNAPGEIEGCFLDRDSSQPS